MAEELLDQVRDVVEGQIVRRILYTLSTMTMVPQLTDPAASGLRRSATRRGVCDHLSLHHRSMMPSYPPPSQPIVVLTGPPATGI